MIKKLSTRIQTNISEEGQIFFAGFGIGVFSLMSLLGIIQFVQDMWMIYIK